MSKVCFRCRVVKPRDEFYVHPMMADGLLGKCKACTRAEARANRAAKLDDKRAYDRARYGQRAAKGHWRKKCQRSRELHPERNSVYAKVTRAIKAGRLLRPEKCETCGETKKLQAHHDDYDKPLDVRWLCVHCHIKVHALFVEPPKVY